MVLRFNKLFVVAIAFLALVFSFCLVVKFDNPSVETSQEYGIRLPIVMYHHMTENPKKANKYTVLASEFEEDLKYIKQKGYSTVTMHDLIEFVAGRKTLPEKPIVITFDDGFYSTYKLAYPLLQKYKMCAVVSVIGETAQRYTDIDDHNLNYANLNWEEIAMLDKTDEIEIQNHTYNMHEIGGGNRKGLSRKNGESESDYETVLTDDLKKMQDLLYLNSGVIATTIAYPYGAFSKQTLGVVKNLGFKSTLLCEERINMLYQGDESCLFGLGRFNRESGVGTEKFYSKLL